MVRIRKLYEDHFERGYWSFLRFRRKSQKRKIISLSATTLLDDEPPKNLL